MKTKVAKHVPKNHLTEVNQMTHTFGTSNKKDAGHQIKGAPFIWYFRVHIPNKPNSFQPIVKVSNQKFLESFQPKVPGKFPTKSFKKVFNTSKSFWKFPTNSKILKIMTF